MKKKHRLKSLETILIQSNPYWVNRLIYISYSKCKAQPSLFNQIMWTY